VNLIKRSGTLTEQFFPQDFAVRHDLIDLVLTKERVARHEVFWQLVLFNAVKNFLHVALKVFDYFTDCIGDFQVEPHKLILV